MMRVLSKVSHDDRHLGEIYELEGELLDRFLAGGIVVPADQWKYEYIPAPRSGTGDQRHVFTRVAPEPASEVAPDPDAPTADAPLTEVAPEPKTGKAPKKETR